ncbi:purine-binding chemotaxis protein CheW [Haloterrigena salifodinae]|uniref:Purine-binding chemotaxis protein CheW n=1 Tax=Haloterrigena salifodinae TaxID=2675099 RepID=A0A8T8E156_9EURY|nr:chemotaxis protein CheW [Haloterrigena salifodinae]QRV15160.1 purine-binding chemotaxis protein CheW [Haloterrigena salifodinae]
MTDERAERIKRIRNRSRSQATANANNGDEDESAADDAADADAAPETDDSGTNDLDSRDPEPTATDAAAGSADRSDDGVETAAAAESGSGDVSEPASHDVPEHSGGSAERATEPTGQTTQPRARAAEPAARTGSHAASAPGRGAEPEAYGGGQAARADPATRANNPLTPAAESAAAGDGAAAGRVQQFDAADGMEPIVDATALETDTASGDGSVLRGAVGAEDGMFADDTALNHSARSDESTVQVLEFSLNNDRYAIAIDRISAIVEMKEITRFPRGPEAIDGVTDLRGEITAVVDPTALLNIERSEPSDEQYIVVLNRGDDKQKLGIRVTEVRQAATYHEDQIDESRGADDNGHEFVDSVIKKPNGDHTSLISWLDIDSIIEQIK